VYARTASISHAGHHPEPIPHLYLTPRCASDLLEQGFNNPDSPVPEYGFSPQFHFLQKTSFILLILVSVFD